MKVWKLASHSEVKDWQKDWKPASRNPVYSKTKKKIVDNSKTSYMFWFPNNCVAHIVYDSTKGSAVFKLLKCPDDKCMDHEGSDPMLKHFQERMKIKKFVLFVLTKPSYIQAHMPSLCTHAPLLSLLHLQLRRGLLSSNQKFRLQVRSKPREFWIHFRTEGCLLRNVQK